MKIIFPLTALIASLSAFELIHVSNSIEMGSLEELQDKYKKDIVISDSRAYIVPSECLLVRHFGGLSQNRANIVGQEFQNGYISITQEVFEAKDVQTIKKEIQKQKISDVVEAKVAKAFLDDKEGHLFGGLSQGNVDLRAQKDIVKERNIEAVQKSYKHPTCKLLNDGFGYMLFDTKEAKLYKNNEIKLLQTSTIPFN